MDTTFEVTVTLQTKGEQTGTVACTTQHESNVSKDSMHAIQDSMMAMLAARQSKSKGK